MRAARTIGVAAATTVLVAASYVVHPFDRGRDGHVSVAAPTALASLEVSTGADRRETERLIGAYEAQVGEHPNVAAFVLLAKLYLSKARLTGDIATYEQAGEAVARARALAPRDGEARALDAAVRFSLHDFTGARDAAAQLLADDGSQSGAMLTLADAHLELGEYDAAEITLNDVGARATDSPAVAVRRARLAFLRGDASGASRLAGDAERLAVASGVRGVDLAFYRAYRGQIAFDRGRPAEAAGAYIAALDAHPGDRIALSGLARVRAGEGRLADAASLYEAVVRQVPDPVALGALGDVYDALGRPADARRQYDTVGAVATVAVANRQVYDRTLVVFDANHGLRPDDAVRRATAELAVRKDVYGYDAAGWALLQAGRAQAADAYARRALALGTPDATLQYHAGMAAAAVGDVTRARSLLREALRTNPHFDVRHAPLARAALSRLDGGS